MASALELRRRIKSVKSTIQITKAMQMVAISKMRKAQEKALAGRAYSVKLAEILHELSGKVHLKVHPLLLKRKINNAIIILITPNKGLCGALNSSLYRELSSKKIASLAIQAKVSFVTIGKKGRQFAAKTDRIIQLDYEALVEPNLTFASSIAKTIMQAYTAQKTDLVLAVYAHFQSTLKQVPRVQQILPVERFILSTEIVEAKELNQNISAKGEYLLEPNADFILNTIVPHYVESLLYQLLLEATVSEHSARMIAMKNATDNALELSSDLTFTYNQLRQDTITREILDIATSVAALA